MTTAVAEPARRVALRVSLLSPLVAFPAVWLLGVALAQIHVLRFQDDWSAVTWLVMLAVPVAFTCGGVLGERLALRAAPAAAGPAAPPRSSRRLRKVLALMVVVGFGEIMHQSISSGSVPIVSESIDLARTTQVGGPSVVLLELLTVSMVVALCVPRRLLAREARFELGIAAVSLGLLLLQGGRGLVVLPIAVAFFARWLYWGRPRTAVVVTAGAVLLLAISGVFFARAAQNPAQPFQAEIFNEVVPATPDPLVPLLPVYFGLATNFSSLANIVDHFPERQPFGGGAYDIRALDSVLSGSLEIGRVSETLNPPWVTSTAAGSLWADGGLPWVVIGIALIGMLCAGGYRYARSTRAFRHALVASYLLYLALFSVYSNYWTSFVNWVFVIPVLALVGAVAENPVDPPGLIRKLRDSLAWARRRGAVFARRAEPALSPLLRVMPTGDQLSRAWRRLRSPIGIAVVALAALVAAGYAVKESTPEGGLVVDETVKVGPPPTQASGGTRLVTDGDLPSDNAPLWVIDAGGGAGAVSIVPLEGKRPGRRQELKATIAPAPRDQTLDVARWNPNIAADDMFRISPTPTGARVRVERLRPTGGLLVAGQAQIPPAVAGMTREFAIARWSGSRPDLFVIDRGGPAERGIVRIFSGESAFSELLLDVRLPVAGLEPRRWTVDVGNALGPADGTEPRRPDLVMVLRDGSQAGQPEVHVITGESGFQQFGLQRVMPLSERVELRSRFVFGARQGAGTIYAVSPRRGQPRVVRLISFLPPAEAV